MENPFEIIIERLYKIESILNDILQVRNTVNENISATTEVLNIDEVAQLLWVKKSTIYHYTSTQMIPHSRIGRRLCFVKSEIIDWMIKNKVRTIEEIKNEAEKYLLNKGKY